MPCAICGEAMGCSTILLQLLKCPVQERKAAEKVKRDAKLNGNAHEMARYDKGSMLLNLIMSKKGDSSLQQVGPMLHEGLRHLGYQSDPLELLKTCHLRAAKKDIINGSPTRRVVSL